jgi:hypothetical protein
VWLTITPGSNTYAIQCKNATGGSACAFTNVQIAVAAP